MTIELVETIQNDKVYCDLHIHTVLGDLFRAAGYFREKEKKKFKICSHFECVS